jgi:hypothetical protein
MSCFCCSSQIVTIRFPEVKNHIWSWRFFYYVICGMKL